MNDFLPQHKAKPGHIRECNNWRVQDGTLVRRLGATKWNSSAIGSDIVRGLGVLYTPTRSILVFRIGNTIYSGDDATGTGASVAAGYIGDPKDTAFTNYKDQIFACDGENRLVRWDGNTSSVQLVGTTETPRGAYLMAIDNRLFQAKVFENEDQVVWTDVGSYEEWAESTNFANIDPFSTGGTGAITGIKGIQGYPAIYKNTGVTRLFATGNGYVTRTVFTGKGCVAPKSLVDSGTHHFYLGEDAIYRYGAGGLEDITSTKIPGAFAEIDPAFRANAVGVYFNHEYRLFYKPKDGRYSTNRRCLIWSDELGEWIGNDTYAFGINCAVARTDTGELFVGSQEDGTIWRLDDKQADNGTTSIDADCRLIHDDFGSTLVDKRFYRTYLHHGKTGTNGLTVKHYCGSNETGNTGSVALDGSSSTWGAQTWGNTVWVGTQDRKTRLDLVNGSGNSTFGTNMSLRLIQTGVTMPATIHGYDVTWDIRGIS